MQSMKFIYVKLIHIFHCRINANLNQGIEFHHFLRIFMFFAGKSFNVTVLRDKNRILSHFSTVKSSVGNAYFRLIVNDN